MFASERLRAATAPTAAFVGLLGLGAIIGMLSAVGGRFVGIAMAGAVVIAIIYAIPTPALIVSATAVSVLVPKMGGYVHGVPLDAGVLLSGVVVSKEVARQLWTRTLKASPWFLLWTGWVVFELVRGVLAHGQVSWLFAETTVFIIPMGMAWVMSTVYADRWPSFLKTVWIAAAVLIAYTILGKIVGQSHLIIPGVTAEYGSPNPNSLFILKNNLVNGGQIKAAGTYQNGNLLGEALALFVPLFLLMPERLKPRKWILFGLGVVASVLTLSRSAWLGLLVNMVALGILEAEFRLALVAVAIMLAAILGIRSFEHRAFHSLGNLSGRLPQLQNLWLGLTQADWLSNAKHWLTGWGIANGPPFYLDGVGVQWGIDISWVWIFLSTGLIGLSYYIGFVVQVFVTAWRHPHARLAAVLLLGAMVSQASDSQLFYPPTAWNFWIVAGLAMAMANSSVSAVTLGARR